jgi:hypothetical protein
MGDWKIYLSTMAYLGVVNSGYSGSVSIPQAVIYQSRLHNKVLHSNDSE